MIFKKYSGAILDRKRDDTKREKKENQTGDHVEYCITEFNRELSQPPAGPSALTDNDLLNLISWVKGPDESVSLLRVFFGDVTLS